MHCLEHVRVQSMLDIRIFNNNLTFKNEIWRVMPPRTTAHQPETGGAVCFLITRDDSEGHFKINR